MAVPLVRKSLILRGLVDSGRLTSAFLRENTGNSDGYQNKGVAGEAKRIVVKRGGLAKLSFVGPGSRGIGLGRQNETGPQLSQDWVAQTRADVNTFLLWVLVFKLVPSALDLVPAPLTPEETGECSLPKTIYSPVRMMPARDSWRINMSL